MGGEEGDERFIGVSVVWVNEGGGDAARPVGKEWGLSFWELERGCF